MKTTPNPAPYSAVPAKVWKRKPGFTGCPERVSVHGALPTPREAYTMEDDGGTIYDVRDNTFRRPRPLTMAEAETMAAEWNAARAGQIEAHRKAFPESYA